MTEALTGTQVLARAREVLVANGYEEVPSTNASSGGASSRLFEDPYGIVLVHVFDGWSELAEKWQDAQGQLVDLISEHLRRPEPKAWEGYLVLLTPGLLPPSERTTLNSLRGDTNRVRKLVAAGDDLATLTDVRNSLLPLLPLDIDESFSGQFGLFDSLPELLEESAIPRSITEIVVNAFTANESILDRLHSFQASQ